MERKKVTKEYIENLSQNEKNKMISENVVQSTLHFQKRIDKLFYLMQNDFFDGSNEAYHVSSYFYRIEFQQRGAPHVHSLLWLKNQVGDEAPNFWVEPKEDQADTVNQQDMVREDQIRIEKVEKFADFLISTCPENITCDDHKVNKTDQNTDGQCSECKLLKEKVEKYQSHNHTFTCAKKMRTISIKESEGYGRFDGQFKGPVLENIPVCRFRFPKFPLDETKLIRALPKDADEKIIKARKNDLNKIIKFLLRQTHTEKKLEDCES